MNRRHRMVFGLLRVGLALALLLTLFAWAAADVARWRHDRRGMESGLSPSLAPLVQPRYGTNVALEQYTTDQALRQALQAAKGLGVGVVRQHLPWAEIERERGQFDWARWDRLVAAVDEADLQLILVLDTSPSWARAAGDADNVQAPAAHDEDYAAFVGTAAARYRGRVLAYQIWDNPNIAPNWGAGEIDPHGYVAMLRQASAAIRAADPAALVLAGGMAPTTELRGRNMSDVLFARELLRLGAAKLCDGLAVKAYGFWSGPYDRRVDEGVLNWSRLVLLREELRRLDADSLSLWAVEGGWVALPEGWAGEPSPLGSDLATVQAERLAGGLGRAREEWPWLGLLCLQALQPAVESGDPMQGLALLGAKGEPTALGLAFATAVGDTAALYPGRYLAGPLVSAQATSSGLDLTFHGTTLLVSTQAGAPRTSLRELDSVEGVERTVTLPPGRAVTLVKAPVASWIGVHLEGSPEQLAQLAVVQVGHERRWHSAWWSVLAALVGGVALALAIRRELAAVPWREGWVRLAERAERLPTWAPAAGLAVLGGVALWGPSSLVRLLGLLGYAALALLYPALSLQGALAALFLAPLNVRLGAWQFSCMELAILIAGAALAWDRFVRGVVCATVVDWWHRRSLADLAVAAYIVLALLAATRAVYQREALRELRLVFIEPALLYGLLRLRALDARRAAETLLWAGVDLALYALVAYSQPSGVIEAEGLRRARAYFGSPNNLALLLERVAPLGLALGLAAVSPRRRWLYLGATALLALGVVLTFSRGAWLLGLPAGLLLVLALHSRRGRRVVVIAVLCGLALLIPLSRVPRFAALADLSSGTSFLRVQLWRSAWQMVRDHPLTGVGPDNFLYYYGDYILPGAEVDRWLSHPHNIVLDFWLRLGIAGLPLLVLFAWASVRSAIKALEGCSSGHAYALGLLGGMAAMLAHGLVDASLFVPELAGWFLCALALLQGLAPSETPCGE